MAVCAGQCLCLAGPEALCSAKATGAFHKDKGAAAEQQSVSVEMTAIRGRAGARVSLSEAVSTVWEPASDVEQDLQALGEPTVLLHTPTGTGRKERHKKQEWFRARSVSAAPADPSCGVN